MQVNEKITKIEALFVEQKQVLKNLTVQNYFDSAIKIRMLELQKQIVKAIITSKKATN